MPKLFSVLSALIVFVFCQSHRSHSAVAAITMLDTVPAKGTKKPPAPAAGKALIAKSDCLACHRENMKLVGPAYEEVAKKYKPTKENIALLANKIIAGGKGVWGEVPMTPHSTLTVADAKQMAVYILSLKAK